MRINPKKIFMKLSKGDPRIRSFINDILSCLDLAKDPAKKGVYVSYSNKITKINCCEKTENVFCVDTQQDFYSISQVTYRLKELTPFGNKKEKTLDDKPLKSLVSKKILVVSPKSAFFYIKRNGIWQSFDVNKDGTLSQIEKTFKPSQEANQKLVDYFKK